MRLASKDAREFKTLAESLGWRLHGLTANGHLRWTHHEHGELVTAYTPSSWWWAKKDLYAATGKTMPARNRGGRPSRRTRKPQEPNKINYLLRLAHQHGHRMEPMFAVKILNDSHGDLARATATMNALLDRADRMKLKRDRAARAHQPWHPRLRKSLVPPRALAEKNA